LCASCFAKQPATAKYLADKALAVVRQRILFTLDFLPSSVPSKTEVWVDQHTHIPLTSLWHRFTVSEEALTVSNRLLSQISQDDVDLRRDIERNLSVERNDSEPIKPSTPSRVLSRTSSQDDSSAARRKRLFPPSLSRSVSIVTDESEEPTPTIALNTAATDSVIAQV
jgi:hypothetical protein